MFERQRRPVADHGGERGDEDGQELAEGPEPAGLREERPETVGLAHRPHDEGARHHEHEGRGPVLDLAQQVHALVDDQDVQAPEEQEREPLGGGVAEEPGAQEAGPAGDEAREERLQGLAADPGLDPEPAAGHERAHERGEIRAEGAVGGAREDGKRDAVLRARVRVQEDRDEHDRVPEQDRDESLPPVHARGHEAGRQHVGRDAVRHADPERGVVVGGPVARRDRHGSEVLGCRGGSPRCGACRRARRGRRGGSSRSAWPRWPDAKGPALGLSTPPRVPQEAHDLHAIAEGDPLDLGTGRAPCPASGHQGPAGLALDELAAAPCP